MIRKKRLARKDAGVGNWGPRGRNQQPRERVVEVKRKATSTIREEVRQVRSECGVRRRYARMWDVKCRYQGKEVKERGANIGAEVPKCRCQSFPIVPRSFGVVGYKTLSYLSSVSAMYHLRD